MEVGQPIPPPANQAAALEHEGGAPNPAAFQPGGGIRAWRWDGQSRRPPTKRRDYSMRVGRLIPPPSNQAAGFEHGGGTPIPPPANQAAGLEH